MGFNCGIVGLPNVGKSTIFNALTKAQADAQNYPFCTIEPNVGIVPLKDYRLDKLAEIVNTQKKVPTAVEFVDIAGLVKGANKGEGLGNQFLSHIRAVDAIAHVVRCFIDENVTHVEGSVNPQRDIEIIETELLLSDLVSVEKRLEKAKKNAKSGDKEAKEQLNLLEKAHNYLSKGILINDILPSDSCKDAEFKKLELITAKPYFYVANVSEHDLVNIKTVDQQSPLWKLLTFAEEKGKKVVVISGSVEEELIQLDEQDQQAFLSDLGQEEPGLYRLARQGYQILNLITFFTAGPKETRAWTCAQGTVAAKAAGIIHSDFEKAFIRAEVISYEDYVESGGELQAKEKGKMRLEGKLYEVNDGDVIYFRVSA